MSNDERPLSDRNMTSVVLLIIVRQETCSWRPMLMLHGFISHSSSSWRPSETREKIWRVAAIQCQCSHRSDNAQNRNLCVSSTRMNWIKYSSWSFSHLTWRDLRMADLEAVLADVSYLMAMEKSKSTPAASASKKIVLPDRTWVQRRRRRRILFTFVSLCFN